MTLLPEFTRPKTRRCAFRKRPTPRSGALLLELRVPDCGAGQVRTQSAIMPNMSSSPASAPPSMLRTKAPVRACGALLICCPPGPRPSECCVLRRRPLRRLPYDGNSVTIRRDLLAALLSRPRYQAAVRTVARVLPRCLAWGYKLRRVAGCFAPGVSSGKIYKINPGLPPQHRRRVKFDAGVPV